MDLAGGGLTLYAIAERERRTPRDQAGLILAEALKRREARRCRVPQREREVAARAS